MHWRATLYSGLLAGLATCSGAADPPMTNSRTYRLGFSEMPPVPTVESVVATITRWAPVGDVALVTKGVPWRALLADTSAAALIRRDLLELVQFYRSRSLPIIVQVDATDGLAREREAPELVALGRSITEPEVQRVYDEYVLAMDSVLAPEYLGLAMEVNLVRAIAPGAVYAALVAMTNAAAAKVKAQRSAGGLFVSFQVDRAWGRLGGPGTYQGIAQERADFPFIQAAGLSAYPYLAGYSEPEDVPTDYYARVTNEAQLPGLVVEGGWTSASVQGISSSPDKQARWIRRQMQLADAAGLLAVTQITFTDLDLSAYPPAPPGSILPLFAQLGLVNTQLQPKPALTEWEAAFAKPLR